MKICQELSVAMLCLALTQASSSAWAEDGQPVPQMLDLIWSSSTALVVVPSYQVDKFDVRPRQGELLPERPANGGGRIMVLARRQDAYPPTALLLQDFERDGFEKPIELQLKGARSNSVFTVVTNLLWLTDDDTSGRPSLDSMTIDEGGDIWVGGATEIREGSDSVTYSHAYVARLDSFAVPIWERSIKAGKSSSVIRMIPAATGDVLVASDEASFPPSWLAMIAAKDGSVVWQRRIGSGRGVDVVPTGSDGFLVATFDTSGTPLDYREDVVVRKVTAAGDVGAANIVRPDVDRLPGAGYGKINMTPVSEGAYVLSSWPNAFQRSTDSKLAKVDAQGRLVWSVDVPYKRGSASDGNAQEACREPTVATLSNGDAMVACSLGDQIVTHQFSQLNGGDKQAAFWLPDCGGGHGPAVLSLFPRPDGRMLVSGTRAINNPGWGCSWLARLPIE